MSGIRRMGSEKSSAGMSRLMKKPLDCTVCGKISHDYFGEAPNRRQSKLTQKRSVVGPDMLRVTVLPCH